ncbi:MAG: 50S ribosomal protein L4 [Acidimicrobiia bacterium]|nr:50S ribosomal protein L4 [Acidimicrobiia bacterium]
MADKKLTAPLYDAAGATKGTVDLDASIFGIEPNVDVMHQVVTAQLAAARSGTAKTKTRSEVRGGGRKPWRQKGLGRARHGSIRSPQWRGGGVVFGPIPRSYAERTPKKMKRLALRSSLSARAAEDQVRVIEAFDWSEPKTKAARELLTAVESGAKALVVLGDSDVVAAKSFRNLPKVNVLQFGQLNTYDVLWADTVVFDNSALQALSGAAYEVTQSDFVKEDDGGEEE